MYIEFLGISYFFCCALGLFDGSGIEMYAFYCSTINVSLSFGKETRERETMPISYLPCHLYPAVAEGGCCCVLISATPIYFYLWFNRTSVLRARVHKYEKKEGNWKKAPDIMPNSAPSSSKRCQYQQSNIAVLWQRTGHAGPGRVGPKPSHANYHIVRYR